MDILIFVEDPGAANYLFQLPSMLAIKNFESVIIAAGTAASFLEQRLVDFVPLKSDGCAHGLLKQYSPRAIIVGTSVNPDSVGLDLINHSKLLNISCIGAVDTYVNARLRFSGRSDDALKFAPDWLLVADERTQQAFADLGYPRSKVIVCGHPQYDTMRRIADGGKRSRAKTLKQDLLPGVDEQQKVILFASVPATYSHPSFLNDRSEFTLKGSGDRCTQTEIVIESFIEAARTLPTKPYLILRLHPRQTVDDVAGLEQEFDMISSSDPVLELILASDLVVGLPTMLLVEAAIMGKPTLAIVARPPTEVLLPTIGTGHTLCVHDQKALETAISVLLSENVSTPIKHEIDELVYDALQTIGEFIEKLLRNEKQKNRRRDG